MSNWIQISERMPAREETNGHETVWAVDERGTHWIWNYVMSPISRFVHPPIAWHAFPRYTPPAPGPTDNECTELIYRITNERWDESAVKGWFADVTARIEKEEGT